MNVHIEAHAMLSFRNRLLILLIGIVVGAQTVTLVTALVRTNANEWDRADKMLRHSAQTAAQQVLDERQKQLAAAVKVLVQDQGLRETLAKAADDRLTLASALGNHAERIHADLALALDADGNLLAQGEGTVAVDAGLIAALNNGIQHGVEGAQFVMSRAGTYQVFTAAPDEIQLAFGFALDRGYAKDLAGARRSGRRNRVPHRCGWEAATGRQHD
ncbi:MAG: cache domain-containing protein [Pseudomonadota bacterium]